jgi:hypothetical protein
VGVRPGRRGRRRGRRRDGTKKGGEGREKKKGPKNKLFPHKVSTGLLGLKTYPKFFGVFGAVSEKELFAAK